MSNAFVGGTASVAFLGLATVIGAWVLPASVLLAGSSPYAVESCRRLFTRRGSSTWDHHGTDGPPAGGHGPRSPEPRLRSLSDRELCHAWEASSHALSAAASPVLQARIVEARHAYLDELSRRNSRLLDAWLLAATDWDRLIAGQDDP